MERENWRVNLYVLWVTQICSLTGFGLSVPFIPYYLQSIGVEGTGHLNFYVGLASTLPAAAMAIFSPIWGIISDIYGRKLMIIRAMSAAALLFVFMGLTNSPEAFLLLRALQGVFTGTITASMTFVSANTPEHKMSFAIGFMTSSNFLGSAIGPAIGGVLAEMLGYKTCFYCGSLIMATGAFLVIALVKEDKNTYGKHINIDIHKDVQNHKVFTKYVIAVLVIIFFTRIAKAVFVPFIALYVQDRLGTISGATRYTGIINSATGITTAIAALTLTRLGDHHSKLKVSFYLISGSFLISLMLIFNLPLWIFTILYAGYFLFAGAVEPVLTSAVSEETDPFQRGTLFGVMGTVTCTAMMIAPMIGAAVSAKCSVSYILFLIPLFSGMQILVMLVNHNKLSGGR